MTLRLATLAVPLLLAVLAQGCHQASSTDQDHASSQETNGGKLPAADSHPGSSGQPGR